MKLNCKIGDRVIVVGGRHSGKVFNITQSNGDHLTLMRDGTRVVRWWGIDGSVWNMMGQPIKEIEDEYLRPLRDSDEPDETLAWAGKPQDKKVKA